MKDDRIEAKDARLLPKGCRAAAAAAAAAAGRWSRRGDAGALRESARQVEGWRRRGR
jgi:hypothetical protein